MLYNKYINGIDFTEIPPSNGNGREQDLWEVFSAEFLELLGYKIESLPARGADEGKDMIVSEFIESTQLTIRWLVSCKHYAKSGKNVSKSDERDIIDRLNYFNCNGFMPVYSTSMTQTLSNNLEFLKSNNQVWIKVYNASEIKKNIIGNPKFDSIFFKFFPNSYKYWHENFYIREPVKLLNYYLNSKKFLLNFKGILLEVFKSEGLITKLLRSSSYINDFFKMGGKTFVIVNDCSYNRKDNLWDIGKSLFECAGLEFKNPIMSGTGLDMFTIYVVTSDYIVVTEKCGDLISNYYNDLKSLID